MGFGFRVCFCYVWKQNMLVVIKKKEKENEENFGILKIVLLKRWVQMLNDYTKIKRRNVILDDKKEYTI